MFGGCGLFLALVVCCLIVFGVHCLSDEARCSLFVGCRVSCCLVFGSCSRLVVALCVVV